MLRLLGREVNNGAFPWLQTILKQLEEWHVFVSCDQLEETLQAAPTLLLQPFETMSQQWSLRIVWCNITLNRQI